MLNNERRRAEYGTIEHEHYNAAIKLPEKCFASSECKKKLRNAAQFQHSSIIMQDTPKLCHYEAI